MVDDELMSYRDDAVRALAWAIRSPNLMDPLPGLDFQTLDVFQVAYDNARPWLRRLDAEPAPLRETIKALNTWKVGVYFETLISYWLTHQSEFTILGHNPQVMAEKRTLGAFDFIVRDPAGQCEHWEVAVKFYLQQRPSAEWPAWVGPNQRDRLDLKLTRMRDHQLPLAHTAPGKACLNNLGVPSITAQRALLKGALFTSWGEVQEPLQPEGMSAFGQRGIWVRVKALAALIESAPERRWYRREKPDWLGPAAQEASSTLDGAECLSSFKTQPLRRPQLWSWMVESTPQRWCETQLVFVVPNDW